MLAIVLSRRDFRENDQIISLYTKEHGKLELLARGVKKIISKQSAHLEPFSVVFITVEQGKEIDHLIKTQPVEYFSGIRAEISKSLAAGYVVAVTDKLTQVGERDLKIFDALLDWLKHVEKSERFNPLLVDGHIVSLFNCLGFAPVLDECVVCGKSFQDIVRQSLAPDSKFQSPNSGFYFAGGGVICSDCRVAKEKVGEEIFDCGLKEVSDMALLLKGDWKLVEQYELSSDEQKKIHRLVYEFAVYHSEKKLADWKKILV